MHMKWTAAAMATLMLGACTGTSADAGPETPATMAGGACKADALQSHIGHIATEASGAVLLKESGARTLRWAPPNSALTMDYRPDRLTVGYDDSYKIISISCG